MFPGGGCVFLKSLLTCRNKEYIVDTKVGFGASVGLSGKRGRLSPRGGPQSSPSTRRELGIWCGVLRVGRGSGMVGATADVAIRRADAVGDADRP